MTEVLPGEIHSNRQQRQTKLIPKLLLLADLLEYIKIQLIQQMVFEQNGDKAIRSNDVPARLAPARKRFKRRNLAVFYAVERVVINIDPAAFQRKVDVLNDVALVVIALLCLRGEECRVARHIVIEQRQRAFCIAVRLRKRKVRLPQADAGAEAGGFSRGYGADGLIRIVQPRNDLLRRIEPCDQNKAVVFAARYERIRERVFQRLRDQAEQPVALLVAIAVVIGLQRIDVRINKVRRFAFRALLADFFAAEFMQIIDVGKLRERVFIETVVLQQRIQIRLLLQLCPRCGKVRAADKRKLRAIGHGLPFAVAVQRRIRSLRIVLRAGGIRFAAENHVAIAALMEEIVQHLLRRGKVLRVDALGHAARKPIGKLFALLARVLAEPIGK